MLVTVGAPGTTLPGVTPSGTSLDAATNYASQIMSRSVMEYVVANNPEVGNRHFTADDLLVDVVAAPSTTAATVTITATAVNAKDCVLLANAVSSGFQNYIQSQRQAALDADRTILTTRLTADVQEKNKDQQTMQQIANTTDVRYVLASNDLQYINQQITSIQTQIDQLPTSISSDIFVIQKAKAIDVQSSSKGSLVTVAAGGGGFLIGVLIMFLMIFLDDRLRGEDRVKEKLGMAYLGGLSSDKQIKENPALAKNQAMHQFADICVNLRLTGVLPGEWHSPRGAVLLITSAQVAEGKTSVATGIATSVARGGGSVVVVDGNLQKPTTHLAFGISTTGLGLAGMLKGTGAEVVDAAVVRSNVPGVWVMPGGQAMDNATLSIEHKFPGIVAQLRQKTDLVIIDGPALLSGSDALLLATMVDGVALVVDSRHDKIKILLRAKEMLSSLTHTPAGVILNRLPHRKRNNYFASASPVDATAEKLVRIATPASNGNGNFSIYERRGEAPAINPVVPSPVGNPGMPPIANSPMPPVALSTPVSGSGMAPELSSYLASLRHDPRSANVPPPTVRYGRDE